MLLIVPYGIETQQSKSLLSEDFLLIVPYGIETYVGHEPYTDRCNF